MSEDRHQRGFTLIEFLVVIAVVSILAVAVVLAIKPQNFLASSRDSTRLKQLGTFQQGLELYFTRNGGVYPKSVPQGLRTLFIDYAYRISDLYPNYLKTPPADPTYGNNCPTMVYSINDQGKYTLFVKLEDTGSSKVTAVKPPPVGTTISGLQNQCFSSDGWKSCTINFEFLPCGRAFNHWVNSP